MILEGTTKQLTQPWTGRCLHQAKLAATLATAPVVAATGTAV